ncbi:MAG: hypothetical protein KBT57_05645 [bacterium]|nr:hypothetical protein [Candidatus Limimorpha equi]
MKNAKAIKSEILDLRDTFDLYEFSKRFHAFNMELSSIMITENWNKGGKNANYITRLTTILTDYNQYENKIPQQTCTKIREDINYIQGMTEKLYNGSASVFCINNCKSHLDNIDRELSAISEKRKRDS